MIMVTGYALAILMGMSLGVIGAGGSILTVPILVYFLGVPPVLATSYSLLLVGMTALFGSYQYYRRDQINFKMAALFAIPSLIAVYATRRWLIQWIPDPILQLEQTIISKDQAIMLLFVSLMMLASYFMLRNPPSKSKVKSLTTFKASILVGLEGIVVGVLTGLIGAGGGFLIIPALVLLVGLDMKVAIGSSLFIIALKSLFGFVGDFQAGIRLDYVLLALFMSCTFVGLVLGTTVSKFLPSEKLKKGFGWFTLLMGIAILVKEL